MQIKIKRIDETLPLPTYQTLGSVAFDIYARIDITIPPQSLGRIPSNLIIQVPKGYVLVIKDRSSTAGKGLLFTAGVIDQDFCGPQDEIQLQVYNYTKNAVSIYRGQRIAQGIFLPIEKAQWQEISEDIQTTNRQGFGSTGL